MLAGVPCPPGQRGSPLHPGSFNPTLTLRKSTPFRLCSSHTCTSTDLHCHIQKNDPLNVFLLNLCLSVHLFICIGSTRLSLTGTTACILAFITHLGDDSLIREPFALPAVSLFVSLSHTKQTHFVSRCATDRQHKFHVSPLHPSLHLLPTPGRPVMF